MHAAALSRLRAALEQAGNALASADLEALLRAELAIEDALAAIPADLTVTTAERVDVGGHIDGVRAALLRCRRLGAALSAFAHTSLDAQGHHAGYGLPLRPAADAGART